MDPNYIKWPKKNQKWPKNDILMSGGTYLGLKSKIECILLSSTFDVEVLFQRYMLRNEILAKKWQKNGLKMTFQYLGVGTKSKKKCSPLSSIFDVG